MLVQGKQTGESLGLDGHSLSQRDEGSLREHFLGSDSITLHITFEIVSGQ